MSSSERVARQPSSSSARGVSAQIADGSPSRRGAASVGISRPVIRRAASRTSQHGRPDPRADVHGQRRVPRVDRFEGAAMRRGQVEDMDVVADGRAIGRRMVRSEDAHDGASARRGLEHDRDQVRGLVPVLAARSVVGRTRGVEVAQRRRSGCRATTRTTAAAAPRPPCSRRTGSSAGSPPSRRPARRPACRTRRTTTRRRGGGRRCGPSRAGRRGSRRRCCRSSARVGDGVLDRLERREMHDRVDRDDGRSSTPRGRRRARPRRRAAAARPPRGGRSAGRRAPRRRDRRRRGAGLSASRCSRRHR